MRSKVPGLEGLASRIAAGELQGPQAFDAVVALIAAAEARPGQTEQELAQIRDEVVLGVSHDRELCALLFEARAQNTGATLRGYASTEPARSPPPDPRARPDPDRSAQRQRSPASGRSVPPEAVDGLDDGPASEGVADPPAALPHDPPRRERPPRRPPKRPRRRPDDDVDVDDFGSSQLRGRLLGAGAFVLVAVAGVAFWWFTRSDACDRLVKDICLDASTKVCEAGSFRKAVDAADVEDSTCDATRQAIAAALEGVPNSRKPVVFTKTLIEGLGFDPRGDAAPTPPAKKEEGEEEVDAKVAVPVITDQAGVTSLFVDRSHVYWTRPNPAGVFRATAIGGAIETVGATPDPVDVTATRDYVYWVSRAGEQAQVWVDQKRGTHEPAPLITAGFRPQRAAFLGADYAFVDGATGAIVVAAVSGGPPRNLTVGGAPVPTLIAGNSTTLYWATPAPAGTLMAAAIDGKTPPRVVAQGLTDPRALLVDGSGVYWIEGSTGSIVRIATGQAQAQALATKQAGPADLALDEQNVYWSNATGGTVMMVPKAGGDPTAVATGQASPSHVVVDGAAIYWVAGANVLRMPK